MEKWGKFFLVAILVISVSLASKSCGGGGDGGSGGGSGPSTSSGPRDLPGASSGTVQANTGGTLATSNGISIEIPPGALSQNTNISIIPLKIDDLQDLFINAVRFEPEGTTLAIPGLVRFPLPATWDGNISPEIYFFSGKDPKEAMSTGTFAKITGTAGAYIAEVEVKHFSTLVMARNCHSGAVKRLMSRFQDRSCPEQYLLKSATDCYAGITLSSPAIFDFANPDQIQALWDTFFEDIGGWNEGQDVPQDVLNQIFQYAREGRIVGLAFTGGNWGPRFGPYNFYDIDPRNYRHTAVLEIDQNNRIQIGNTSPTKSDALRAAMGGEVSYTYPAEGGGLNAFRKLRLHEALELYLCGSPGCLEDKSRNKLGLDPYKGQPYAERVVPWGAVRIYVERAQKLEATVQLSTGDGWSFPVSCPMGGFAFIDLVGGGWPSIYGFSQESEHMILSMLNKQLAGPGIYQNIGILTDGNDADITYTNANITQYYGSPVPFRAISPGYLNLEFYGVKLKDRIKGFFSVKIEGTQEICLDPTWDSSQLCSSETEIPITGTIQGNFDGYLLYKTESGI